ncbi:hypothetical protein [Massilimicrobiota timonensis]|uniref:hypothetical protein n=1 Tax=Massilimicrobiota timonensis TaxID=1776392 RepID=UPI003B8A955A
MKSLKEFQRKIKTHNFYRVNHSVLVNKNCIIFNKIISNKKSDYFTFFNHLIHNISTSSR